MTPKKTTSGNQHIMYVQFDPRIQETLKEITNNLNQVQELLRQNCNLLAKVLEDPLDTV